VAGYVELDEVRTWLAAHFHVFTPDRRGHGRTPDVEGPITCELMANDTIAFLERIVGGPARLVGCSAGASVALLVALRRPELAERLVLICGVFHRDGWIPTAIDPDASTSYSRAATRSCQPDGPDHFPVVSAKLARLNWEEPTLSPSDLGGVSSRTAPPREAGARQRAHRRLPDHRSRAHARPGPPRERMTLGFRLAARSICGCVSPDLGWLEGLVLARRTRE
jgi:pimeloyl-ACP methyl ester carboxylesterase